MFNTPEQFAAANKASVDAMLTLANTALASAERIAALNLNTARSMLEDGVANAKAMLGAKDPQEFFAVQASLAQPGLEKAVAYTRSVYEISAQSKEEISKLLEAQFNDFQKQVLALLEKATKNAPAGSDVAVRRQVGHCRRHLGLRQHEQGRQAGCRHRRSQRRCGHQRHRQGSWRHRRDAKK
jgi:phasin family protein